MVSIEEQFTYYNEEAIVPHGMCYPHYGNGVRNGAISIAQWYDAGPFLIFFENARNRGSIAIANQG